MDTPCEEFLDKGIYICEIQPDMAVCGLFIIINPVRSTTKNGLPYWRFSLTDKTGSIDAKIWPQQSQAYPVLSSGQPARAKGTAEVYNNKLQLTIEILDLLPDECKKEINPEFFIPVSEKNIDEMWNEFRNLCMSEFTYQPWRKLFYKVFINSGIDEAFKKHPAAVSIHHAWIGGLLEHTLGVAKICMQLANLYPFLDRQTLLAGAIYHDLGKLREYCSDTAISSTIAGGLEGHPYLGLEMLMPHITDSNLDEPLADHLKHLILSHHGLPEYGAAKMPQTMEAFILNFADNIDARMLQCKNIFETENTAPGQWSSWQKSLDRRLHNAYKTPQQKKLSSSKKPEPECLSLMKV